MSLSGVDMGTMPRKEASIAIVTAPDFEMTVHFVRAHIRKQRLKIRIRSWVKKWSLGCESFLTGPAWLLLSKTGPFVSKSLYFGEYISHFSLGGYVKLEPTTRGSQEVKSFNPLKGNVYYK